MCGDGHPSDGGSPGEGEPRGHGRHDASVHATGGAATNSPLRLFRADRPDDAGVARRRTNLTELFTNIVVVYSTFDV